MKQRKFFPQSFRLRSRALLVAASVFVIGCSPMNSISSNAIYSKGVRYHLPCSSYRLKIGKESEKLKITVSHEVQADVISFAIDIKRNPLVDRVQNYGLDSKGLLSTAKTQDVGKLSEILEEAAKSVVALTQPSAATTGALLKGMDGTKAGSANNQLSPQEYEFFMAELAKLNFEYSASAGSLLTGKRIPDEGGYFVLDFQAPHGGHGRAGEKEIRQSLQRATCRVSPSEVEGDKTLLSAGVIVRSATSGNMSYKISVSRKALNQYRDGIVAGPVASAAEKKEKVKKLAEDAKLSEKQIADKEKEYQNAISDLEIKIADIEEDGKAMESALTAILDDVTSTRKHLEGFNNRKLHFAKDNDYWKTYGAALAMMPAKADIPEDKMVSFRDKLLAFNTQLQKLANDAKGPLVTDLATQTLLAKDLKKTLEGDLNAKNALLAAATKEHAEAQAKGTHAAFDVPLVVVSERMTVIDESRVQYIPMWRSMMGTAVDEITMVNGLITAHSVNEPSEVLGVVKIPLKVVEAILGTVQSLWTKQKSATDAKADVLDSEAKVIESMAKLEEAKKKEE